MQKKSVNKEYTKNQMMAKIKKIKRKFKEMKNRQKRERVRKNMEMPNNQMKSKV